MQPVYDTALRQNRTSSPAAGASCCGDGDVVTPPHGQQFGGPSLAPHFTKSRYVAGLQCLRRQWLLHDPVPYEEPAPGIWRRFQPRSEALQRRGMWSLEPQVQCRRQPRSAVASSFWPKGSAFDDLVGVPKCGATHTALGHFFGCLAGEYFRPVLV